MFHFTYFVVYLVKGFAPLSLVDLVGLCKLNHVSYSNKAKYLPAIAGASYYFLFNLQL